MIVEQPVTIPGGPSLEAALALPPGAPFGVVLCHPHPRYGGDMDSPVVVAAAEACARRGLATLRFNFRGVGASAGTWDEGRGERDDVRAALAVLRRHLAPPARVALAGYSFGASMATAVAAEGEPLAGLALIAPPLATPGWHRPGPLAIDGPLLVVAGSEDPYCPRAALTTLATVMPEAIVTLIDGADHFFSTGLEALDAALADWAATVVLATWG
jgi:alpha/beta superfamily hydrolase